MDAEAIYKTLIEDGLELLRRERIRHTSETERALRIGAALGLEVAKQLYLERLHESGFYGIDELLGLNVVFSPLEEAFALKRRRH